MNEKVKMKMKGWKLFENFLILIAHLALLAWIMFSLSESGRLTTGQVLMHFSGMALYGGLLIRLCAYLARRRFENELKLNKNSPQTTIGQQT